MSRVTGASWINEVFDPTRKLFGTQKIGAGVMEDAMAGLGQDMEAFAEPLPIGKISADDYYLYAIGVLGNIAGPIKEYLAAHPGSGIEDQLNTFLNDFRKWLKEQIQGSATSQGWGMPGKGTSPLSPRDPVKGTFIEEQYGTGLKARIEEAAARMVYANFRNATQGMGYPQDFAARNLAMQSFPGAPQLTQQMVDVIPLPKWEVTDIGEAPKPSPFPSKPSLMGSATFATIIKDRGDETDIRYVLQTEYSLSYTEAKKVVADMMRMMNLDKVFNIGTGGVLAPSDEAAYNSALADFRAACIAKAQE